MSETAREATGTRDEGLDRQEKQPADEEVTEVAPGILRLQLPVMMPGLGHVNCYAIEDERGFAVVDPGLPGPDSHKILRRRLVQAGASVANIHTVLVTHSHPDHFGGAGRLKLEFGTEVVAHEAFRTIFDPAEKDESPEAITDSSSWRDLVMGEGDELPDLPRRQTPWGVIEFGPGPEELLRFRGWDELSKRGFLTPRPTKRLEDAETIRLGRRDWLAVHTPGHTADHLCLFDPEGGVLLAGDHVLPTITPHISGIALSDDPLAQFFTALDKVAALPDVRHVLPAHGHPFTDLSGRVEDIHRHHEERLEKLVEISQQIGEADVVELSHHLFKPRSWGPMAESETYAHLEHLRLCGRARSRKDEEGRLLFTIDH
ncbi:MAG: MBL fold metallo-hydrolase [Actinobacteria bacterium]|nr:MAG: MBL fold metallo-hydrolase [Actinomycetota bacterium]RIK07845.1 MAG: hypothetical protein DCC48_02515 [Acidobacteriota bacterium]